MYVLNFVAVCPPNSATVACNLPVTIYICMFILVCVQHLSERAADLLLLLLLQGRFSPLVFTSAAQLLQLLPQSSIDCNGIHDSFCSLLQAVVFTINSWLQLFSCCTANVSACCIYWGTFNIFLRVFLPVRLWHNVL